MGFTILTPVSQNLYGVKVSENFSNRFLEEEGPQLGRPYVDTVAESIFPNMKELRVQHKGDPWRILFAFDFERAAILLVGGNKRGNKRWYKEYIAIADRRFQEHLDQL
jgi:hypothetical protein